MKLEPSSNDEILPSSVSRARICSTKEARCFAAVCFLSQRTSFSEVLASYTELPSLAFITNKVSVRLGMLPSSTDTRRSISDADEPPDADADADVDVEGGVAE